MFELVVFEATTGQQLLDVGATYLTEDFAAHLLFALQGGLMVLGALLMLLAGIGLLRLPDLPTRMHASTKAGSLGAAMIMAAVAVAIPDPGVIARSLAVITFLLLTAPVAAHIIGRAGYFVGVPLWDGTVKDDLAEQYDYERHTLASGKLADREIKGFTDVPTPGKEVSYEAFDPGDVPDDAPHPTPGPDPIGEGASPGDAEYGSGDQDASDDDYDEWTEPPGRLDKEAPTGDKPKPEPEAESDTEPEPEPESDTEPESENDTETEADTEADTEPEPEPEPETETESETESETETKKKAEPDDVEDREPQGA